MKKTQPVTIKTVTLNNKSRKGQYIYIKIGKNKPAYYKDNNTLPSHIYLQHYRETYTKLPNKKQKTTLQHKKKQWQKQQPKIPKTQITKILDQTKKQPKLQQQYKKGENKITKNIDQLYTTQQRQQTKQQLIKPLIKDKNMLNLLTQPQNFKQLQTRISYQTTIYGRNGKPIHKANFYNQDFDELITTLTKLKGTTSDTTSYKSQLTQKLKFHGAQNIKELQKGTAQKITLTITLTKA